jgi:3-deoxy-7-phosphoheptulonate synthase
VGFKNGTDGNLRIAFDAIKAASQPHHFLSVTKAGHSAIVSTSGNEDCHIILRGGAQPNYDAPSLDEAARQSVGAGLPAKLMVDASHGNSRKDPRNQPEVVRDIASRIALGENRVFGLMIESHLVAGQQSLESGQPLVYGQSITDGCIGWDDTVGLLDALADAVGERRAALAA